MIKAEQIYQKLNALPVFTLADHLQAQKVAPGRAILINGFWRSGTTFMMEYLEKLLDRRAFFEPMHYSVEQARVLQTPMGFMVNGDKISQCYPFVVPQFEHSEYDAFYERMLRGKVSTPWTRRNRKPNRYFRKDIIVKSVRSNFVAPYLMDKFGIKNIFVIRHPAAVLSSIIRKGSGASGIYKSVGRAEFIELLLSEISGDLPDHQYDKLAQAVAKHQRGALSNTVLSWCLCNYIPLYFYEKGTYNPFILSYESFFLDNDTKYELNSYLSVDRSRSVENFNSSTTKEDRKNISTRERLYSWKQDLNEAQIRKVNEICSSFGELLNKHIEKAEHVGII